MLQGTNGSYLMTLFVNRLHRYTLTQTQFDKLRKSSFKGTFALTPNFYFLELFLKKYSHNCAHKNEKIK